MTKLFPFLILVLFLQGCDVAHDMMEMGEKQAKVQKFIKDKYGWESQVGWNIHNGSLTQVTVIFYAADVRKERVDNLEALAKEAVYQSFNAKPKALFIQIAATPE